MEVVRPRATLRYQLKPVGYGSDAEFYVYSNHYKASTGATNENRRNLEATTVRANADALGQGTSAIYTGDFNIQSSSEAMYQTLLSPGHGQAFDPLNRPGNWHNSSGFRSLHTQSPYDSSFGDSSLVAGGVDDRFDFQLVTGELLDNEGLSYLGGSYRAFGNNGSHSLNDSINDSSNNAQPSNVLNALARVSDHLPVVADYQIPARMGVALGSIPNRMLAGAVVQMPVTVTNTADVVSAQGADELDYTVTGSAAFFRQLHRSGLRTRQWQHPYDRRRHFDARYQRRHYQCEFDQSIGGKCDLLRHGKLYDPRSCQCLV